MTLLIGADPEFFVRKRQHIIPGHVFSLGTKQKPMETKHGFIQNDGLAVEVNVRPAATREAFIQNIFGVRDDLIQEIGNEHYLVTRPSVFFGNKTLARFPAAVRDLGCSPDYNAYTARMNTSPCAENIPFRTGAGHVHIGWSEGENPRSIKHFGKCCRIVKVLDYYLGLPSLIWDKDKRRRRLYGLSGSFRPKPYGLEYRVLSNRWLETEKMMGYVFDRAKAAYEDAVTGWLEADKPDIYHRYQLRAANIIDYNEHEWYKTYPQLADEVLA